MPAAQPVELRGPPRRVGCGIIEDRGAPARPVERIEIFRNGAAGLAQGRDVAAQCGDADPERLNQRKTKTFGERRQQQRAGAFQQPHHLGIRQRVVLDHRAAQAGTAFEHVNDVFGLPAALPDQHEMRRRGAEISGEPAPQIEQQQMIFARFDRPDIDKVRLLQRWRCMAGFMRQIKAERRDEDRRPAPGLVEMRQ
jgi:hypothetical protein